MVDHTAQSGASASKGRHNSIPPRPQRPAEPLWDNFPEPLTAPPQWVCWCYILTRDWATSRKPWTKVPLQPNGTAAKSDDPSTWAPFDHAQCAYYSSRPGGVPFDGVGFVLTANDPFVGFDFDAVLRDGRLTDERVVRWVKLLDSYCEVSPSGSGLRVIARGKLPGQDRKIGPYEVYESRRFLTITGHLFEVPT
jgi:primase-polymerase (primpol)-like protein